MYEETNLLENGGLKVIVKIWPGYVVIQLETFINKKSYWNQ